MSVILLSTFFTPELNLVFDGFEASTSVVQICSRLGRGAQLSKTFRSPIQSCPMTFASTLARQSVVKVVQGAWGSVAQTVPCFGA
jgi:hypothetical protein